MKTQSKWALTLFVVATLSGGGCMGAHRHRSETSPAHQVRHAADEVVIAALFDRWNAALRSGDPAKVVDCYDERSILLPTMSNKPRFTRAEKEDYFVHFMQNEPNGSIDQRWILIDGDSAVDAGLYTFRFAKTGLSVSGRYTFTYRHNGEAWLITSHHSSAMPEK